ncbi:MAG: restriction endonuclease subunit S [Elusimicrobia bacterium]|nr:restriction endonuclease subunit S [Elusimicrobiota bacterium]
MSKGGLPRVSLERLLKPVERPVIPVPGTVYRQAGVRLWGGGAYERDTLDGGSTKYARLFQIRTDDVIINKIWARNGSVGIVPKSLDGCLVSSEFPTFVVANDRLDPRWFHWITKTRSFWNQCDDISRGTSGKNRIKPEQFLKMEIPCPSLPEQRRILVRLNSIAEEVQEVHGLQAAIEKETRTLVLSTLCGIVKDAQRKPMHLVAPIVRRPIEVRPTENYLELGIRSFGKGTFHKPSIIGIAVGSKKLFGIEPGDLVFSNVFAWEGAVAVARPEDAGRVGSHRFISCVPLDGIARAEFLKAYFLTQEGIDALGVASPGGAGRNRTLGIEALQRIEVPVPKIEKQDWLKGIQAKADALLQLRRESGHEFKGLLASVLNQAFEGIL